MTLRLPLKTVQAIDALGTGRKGDRVAFIRAAIEREIKRRQLAKSR
jgi:hypothetical protein